MAKQTAPSSGNKDTSFIRETIRPKKKKWWRSLLRGVLLAVVCGCCGGATFWLLANYGPEMPGNDAKNRADATAPETKESTAQTAADEEQERMLQDLERRLSERITQEVEQQFGAEASAESLTQQIQFAWKKVHDCSMVTVTNIRQSVDWLQNTQEQREDTWALILSIEEDRVLLLANAEDLESGARLCVRFGRRTSEDVTFVAEDSVSRMAVLSVGLGGETLTDVWQPVEFGNSYNLQTGATVLAMGAPLGQMDTLDYGIVSARRSYQEAVDSSLMICYTNMMRVGSSGVLVNLQGQVVGWITDLRDDGMESVTAGIESASLVPVLERLKQGKTPVWLGVVGEEVPEAVQEEGDVPAGLYVTGIQDGSPAFAAGLQYGDIITMFDETTVRGMYSLQSALTRTEAGQNITLTVMRWSREGYSELRIPVELGSR